MFAVDLWRKTGERKGGMVAMKTFPKSLLTQHSLVRATILDIFAHVEIFDDLGSEKVPSWRNWFRNASARSTIHAIIDFCHISTHCHTT